MSKVLVGGISEEGNHLLNMYIDRFLPDATIEPLRAAGIKGKIKNHAKRPEVILVVIDDSLYQMCVGVADEVLSLPKVHRYIDDNGFKQFLISKFGRLDSSDSDMETKSQAVESISPLPISDEISTPSIVKEDDCLDVLDTNDENDKLIKSLRAELSTSNMIIESLKRQIKELTEDSDDNDDYSALRTRIIELEAELETKRKEIENASNQSYADLGKVARAEQVLKEMSDLKDSLNKSKEDLSAVEYEKQSLVSQLEACKNDLEKANAELSKLSGVESQYLELKEKNEEISENYHTCIKNSEVLEKSKSDLEVKVLELNQTLAKLQLDVADKGVLEVRVTELEEKNRKYKDSISELEKKVSEFNELSIKQSNLEVDLATVNSENTSLSSKIESLERDLDEKQAEYSELLLKYDSASDDIKLKEDLIVSLRENISNLTSTIDVKESEITSLNEKIYTLEKDVNSKNNTIASANQTIESLQKNVLSNSQDASESEKRILDLENSLSTSNSKVSDLTFELEKVNLELASVKAKKVEIEEQLRGISDSMNISSIELDSLRSKIIEKDDEIKVLSEKLVELKSSTSNSEDELNKKDSEILTLNAEVRKLKSEIGILKTSSQEMQEKDNEEFVKRNEELESEVTDLKRNLAKLLSEKESLISDLQEARDTSEKDSEIANLRIQVTKLHSELKEKSEQIQSAVDSDKYKDLELELGVLREKCSNLEFDVIDRDEQLKEIGENIFVRMADYSLPKITVPLSVSMPVSSYDNIFTFASGSAESSVSTYQAIKSIVSANTDKTYVVVDLVTDTYIDRELGVRGIKSPSAWLQGSDDVDAYLTSTKYDNVKVISTALAYFNDLFLLNVNWKKRLDEVSKLADIVILSIGSLDNIVHNTLFNSFSTITKCNVIVKATPINLRTAYLHLAGFSQLKNTKIYCMNIEEQSRPLYQKLAAKYPTQILKDTDIIEL